MDNDCAETIAWGESQVAQRREDPGRLAKRDAERNRVGREQSYRASRHVYFDEGGAWLSPAWVSRITGGASERAILRGAPMPRRSFCGIDGCVLAPALATLLQTGVLGDHARTKLRIVEAHRPEDLVVPYARCYDDR